MDQVINHLCDHKKISITTNSLHYIFKYTSENIIEDNIFILVKNRGSEESDYSILESDKIIYEQWQESTIIFEVDKNKNIKVIKE